jgi:ABC-type transporter Mla maintaining outer membrane lipid asymmetry ATPase subunit MlaF
MVIIGFTSCSKSLVPSSSSRATGWNVGSKKSAKKARSRTGLVFVEGGTFTMVKVQDDVMHDWNNTQHSSMFNHFIWMKLR